MGSASSGEEGLFSELKNGLSSITSGDVVGRQKCPSQNNNNNECRDETGELITLAIKRVLQRGTRLFPVNIVHRMVNL